MPYREDGDPRFDLADFVQPGDYLKSPIERFGRAMRLSPGTVLAAAFWRLTGRRLRARHRLNAIIGDHLKFDSQRQFRHHASIATAEVGSAAPSASCAIVVPVLSEAEAGAPLAASLNSLSRRTTPEIAVFVPVPAEAGWRATVALRGEGDRIVAVANARSRADLVNAVAESCHHDILIVLEPGCALRGAAVALATQALASGAAVIAYADEIVRRRDHPYALPLLKPDFDEDLLLRLDFVGPFLAARRADFIELGGYRSEMEGAEARDLVLRTVAAQGETAVAHIAEPIHERDETVPWAITDRATTLAARRAGTAEHLQRSGTRGDLMDAPGGRVALSRELAEPLPLVSIIVPTRDRVDLFEPCVRGVLDRTDYPHLEVVIADNGSREPATLALYEALSADARVRIVDAAGPFNFSKICNVAAAASHGEVLLFLNNDIEVRDAGWLRAMVAEAVRPEVGAVGAMLLYPNEIVQHAGVVVGVRGLAAHAFQFFPFGHPGYLWLLATTRRCSAVTAACLAVTREKFAAVGGFDADAFPVSLNDVDLCLKLDQAGFRTLYVAEACLTHKESASRRSDRASDQTERWQRETAAFLARWGDRIARDPWYGSAFGQVTADFAHARVAPADRARD